MHDYSSYTNMYLDRMVLQLPRRCLVCLPHHYISHARRTKALPPSIRRASSSICTSSNDDTPPASSRTKLQLHVPALRRRLNALSRLHQLRAHFGLKLQYRQSISHNRRTPLFVVFLLQSYTRQPPTSIPHAVVVLRYRKPHFRAKRSSGQR